MTLNEKQLAQLFKPINELRVKERAGYAYLESYDVIAHLTRIFGFEGWSKEVTYALLYESQRDQSGKWDVAYSASCRLSIKDLEGNELCVHEDVATGQAQNQPSRGDAHDLALKSAVSDALKRAAKDLGNQFGNSLYDKGSTRSVVGQSLAYADPMPAEPDPDPIARVAEVKAQLDLSETA
jgi:DNA recombination protein Rad52